MFPTELDDYPTLSSIISFCADLEIQYVDMTAPHKQEKETQAKAQPYHSWHSNVGYSLDC